MDGGPRILIAGGGYGGLHTALRLERLLRPGEATVTVADPRPYMTCQPLLAETARRQPGATACRGPAARRPASHPGHQGLQRHASRHRHRAVSPGTHPRPERGS